MKRTVLWVSGIILALVLVFAALFALNPLMGLVMFAEITGRGYGHPRNPPALADGHAVTANISNRAEKSRIWTRVLEQRFPPGTGVASMLGTLRQQNFNIYVLQRRASYDWGGMPCLYTLDVDWTEDADHRIASIKGSSYSGCL